MASPRTARLRELFVAAADLDAPARQTFLDERCGDDRALRAEVHDLLEHEAKVDDDFLGGLGQRSIESERPGTVIDGFTIERRLGEGAFGVVYLARQRHPVVREVALKVIKPGMDTRDVVQRFEGERQVLALMQHPHIAKVFDAGSTSQGRPYFVMEYVEGRTIDDYCDDNRLTVEQRLALFATVCDAVQHAHQRGILHRDIKPSNILVETVDGAPEAKIIDFGIAKAMRGHVLDGDTATLAGQLLGTPDYMSPEQAGTGSGVVASTTDVYSLGVVLYELVTGVLPFDPRALRREGLGEIQRVIREVDPPKPSTRLARLGSGRVDSADESGDDSDDESFAGAGSSAFMIAERRRTDPRSLRRAISGELDWITMRAMEKDPSRRYVSASELAVDVRRHLRHEPVAAGPPGVGYRLRKFLRRNRLLTAAVLVCSLALVGGVTGVLVQSIRIAREAESTRLINAFYDSMLASVDPMQFRLVSGFAPEGGSFGGTLPVPEMLAQAAPGIDEAFVGKPDLEAKVRETFGLTFLSLGRHDDAQEQLRGALAVRARTLDAAHEDVLRSKLLLGYAIWDARRGDYAEAEALVGESLDGLRTLHGVNHAESLNAQRILADVLAYDGRYAEAERLYTDVYERQKALLGERHLDTLRTMHGWAAACLWHGRHDKGDRLARRLLAIATEDLDSNHTITIRARNLAGYFVSYRGELTKAAAMHRIAYDDCMERFGPTHPMTYYLARSYATTSIGALPLEETEALFERAYTGQLATAGTEHREAFFAAGAYATFLRGRGQAARAVDELLAPSLAMWVRTRRADHAVSVMGFRTVTGAQMRLGREEDARATMTQGLEAARQLASRPDASPFDLYIAAGLLLKGAVVDLQEPETARMLLERAIARADEEVLGERFGVLTAYLHVMLIECCQRLGDDACVRARRRERLALVMASSKNSIEIEAAAWRIAKDPAYTEDAYDLALSAVDDRQTLVLPPWYLRTLGAAQYRAGDVAAALANLTRYAEASPTPSPQALALLALAHAALGDDAAAEEVMARLYALPEEVPTTNPGELAAAVAEAESILRR